MPVDPQKQLKVLVVHGVETTNATLNQDQLIADLITKHSATAFDVGVELYKYENINSEALDKLTKLFNLLVSNPVGKAVGDLVIDLAGDVVISLANGSTADTIRKGLKEKILSYSEAGHPCFVVAHSLGTIYSFDVINELIREGRFDRDAPLTWPLWGWLSLGSPIGLKMFAVTGRDQIDNLGDGGEFLRWRNLFDPNDPVVSGNIFGAHLPSPHIAEKFLSADPGQGWAIQDTEIDTGKEWLMAHTAYWTNSAVGAALVSLLAG